MKLGLAAIVVSALLSSCGDPCGNEVVQSVVSPSGSLKAVAFTRNCGATTKFSTQVSILRSNEALPNDPGNVTVLDDIVPLSLEWKTDTSLHVSGFGGRKRFNEASSISGVAISYAN
jgi:hypothetical protein